MGGRAPGSSKAGGGLHQEKEAGLIRRCLAADVRRRRRGESDARSRRKGGEVDIRSRSRRRRGEVDVRIRRRGGAQERARAGWPHPTGAACWPR